MSSRGGDITHAQLVDWINELLQLNYTSVGQLGSGAAFCQVMDVIYRDGKVHTLNWNAKQEHEYLGNLQRLNEAFRKHQITYIFHSGELAKCRTQDNFNLGKFIYNYWERHYNPDPEHYYDPVARRKGAKVYYSATNAPLPTRDSSRPSSTRGSSRSAGTGHLRVGAVRSGGKTPIGERRAGSAQNDATVLLLQNQVKELSGHLEGLEKERDFYFEKLREIEILVQQQLETLEAEGKDDETLRKIQTILYSTEEGFEVPEAGGQVDEEETF